jgi:hypothetical protein
MMSMRVPVRTLYNWKNAYKVDPNWRQAQSAPVVGGHSATPKNKRWLSISACIPRTSLAFDEAKLRRNGITDFILRRQRLETSWIHQKDESSSAIGTLSGIL